MTESYQVFARRFRPQTFKEVIGQDAIVTTMKNALKLERLAHAYLFSGSRGTGKTSLARLFAKAINCPFITKDGEPCNTCTSCKEISEGRSLDVLEIDGASHRGIDDIRSISESVSYSPTHGKYKIYLIDEVHMLTKEAFNALLKTLEEPPPSVKFFFATTEPHKVPATIVSRCQRFNLKRLSPQSIIKKLRLIAEKTGMQVSETAIEKIAQYAEGGLRDAESLFDQVSAFSDEYIDEKTVQDVLGLSPQEWFQELDTAIETTDYRVAFSLSERLFMEGKDTGYFIHDLSEHYKKALSTMIATTQPGTGGANNNTFITVEDYIQILDLIAKAYIAIKSSASSSRIILEWVLISIIQTKLKVPLPNVVKKLIDFEKALLSQDTVSDKTIQHPTKEFIAARPSDTEKTSVDKKKALIPPVNLSLTHEKTSKEALLYTQQNVAEKNSQEMQLKRQLIDNRALSLSSSTNRASINSTVDSPDIQSRGQEEHKEQKYPADTSSLTLPDTDQQNIQLQSIIAPTPYVIRQVPLPSEEEGQEKSRQESIMHFAAVELEGTLIKKPIRT